MKNFLQETLILILVIFLGIPLSIFLTLIVFLLSLLFLIVAIIIEFKYIIAVALFFVILCQLKLIGV